MLWTQGATAWFSLCSWYMSRFSGVQARSFPTHPPASPTGQHRSTLQSFLAHTSSFSEDTAKKTQCFSAAGTIWEMLGRHSGGLLCLIELYQILSSWLELIPSANIHMDGYQTKQELYLQAKPNKHDKDPSLIQEASSPMQRGLWHFSLWSPDVILLTFTVTNVSDIFFFRKLKNFPIFLSLCPYPNTGVYLLRSGHPRIPFSLFELHIMTETSKQWAGIRCSLVVQSSRSPFHEESPCSTDVEKATLFLPIKICEWWSYSQSH